VQKRQEPFASAGNIAVRNGTADRHHLVRSTDHGQFTAYCLSFFAQRFDTDNLAVLDAKKNMSRLQ
jgi:hypothetical protein